MEVGWQSLLLSKTTKGNIGENFKETNPSFGNEGPALVSLL